jgi:hypothetical protein
MWRVGAGSGVDHMHGMAAIDQALRYGSPNQSCAACQKYSHDIVGSSPAILECCAYSLAATPTRY